MHLNADLRRLMLIFSKLIHLRPTAGFNCRILQQEGFWQENQKNGLNMQKKSVPLTEIQGACL
jgi:hypothetical protein